MRFLHTMLRVRNLDTAMKFYQDALGLKEVRRIDNEKGKFTLVFLCAPEDVDRLKSQPQTDTSRLAAIGYCFGGTTALELARSGADLKAAVGFHSGLATARPQDAANIKAKILVNIGADDPVIPKEQRAAFEQEMTE